MFCEKCGNKLDSSDKFCTKCGAPVHSESNKRIFITPASGEKWWYRLLKVAYILLYVGSIGVVCVAAFSSIPHRTLDENLSTIQCNNGKSYAPGNNSIYLYGDSLSSYDDEKARILCAYDRTNYYSYSAPAYKNYTFVPSYNEADYGPWFFYSLLALLMTWTILKLIRLGVQYVVFATKPIWKKEFKKLY